MKRYSGLSKPRSKSVFLPAIQSGDQRRASYSRSTEKRSRKSLSAVDSLSKFASMNLEKMKTLPKLDSLDEEDRIDVPGEVETTTSTLDHALTTHEAYIVHHCTNNDTQQHTQQHSANNDNIHDDYYLDDAPLHAQQTRETDPAVIIDPVASAGGRWEASNAAADASLSEDDGGHVDVDAHSVALTVSQSDGESVPGDPQVKTMETNRVKKYYKRRKLAAKANDQQPLQRFQGGRVKVSDVMIHEPLQIPVEIQKRRLQRKRFVNRVRHMFHLAHSHAAISRRFLDKLNDCPAEEILLDRPSLCDLFPLKPLLTVDPIQDGEDGDDDDDYGTQQTAASTMPRQPAWTKRGMLMEHSRPWKHATYPRVALPPIMAEKSGGRSHTRRRMGEVHTNEIYTSEVYASEVYAREVYTGEVNRPKMCTRQDINTRTRCVINSDTNVRFKM